MLPGRKIPTEIGFSELTSLRQEAHHKCLGRERKELKTEFLGHACFPFFSVLFLHSHFLFVVLVAVIRMSFKISSLSSYPPDNLLLLL